MYALLDANNMYVSCERVFQPRLAGRPVVVLSSNDGACIARSNEARDLGVQMAQPWFQVRHLQKTQGLVAMSANFELYGDMSARMMAIAARFAPRQEVYSIDECFLDVDGVRGDRVAIGRDLRAVVLRETGLPTSVGFGPTKTLAKLANHVAKTADRKPGSYVPGLAQVCDLWALSEPKREAVMDATEAGEVWGIGRKLAPRLAAAGVRSVLDLVRSDAATLRRAHGVVLERTLQELRGTSCLDVDDVPSARKQILVSRSFGAPICSLDGIVEAVSEFASRAAEKLRAQHSLAGALCVFFRTSPFRTHDPQHDASATVPLPRPTADTALLAATAAISARHLFRASFPYAKAGVMLLDLQPESVHQGELDLRIASEPLPAWAKDRSQLMRAMDAVNRRFGRDSLRLASATVSSSRADVRRWATRQDRRSPRYTTRWDEMPVVRA